MKLNKKLFWLVCLTVLLAFAGYATSAVVVGTDWEKHDNPKYGHYMWRNGSTMPDEITKHFQVTQAWWDKMKVLPTFSTKKMPGLEGRPMWTAASGDWEFNQADVLKFVPTNQEMRAYWRDLMNTPLGRERMAIKPVGEFPVGYPLELLIFTKTPDNKPVTEPEELRALGKPIVWLQGPIHGGEQDAADGIFWEAYSLATGEWDKYLEKVSVILLPRINQDGSMMMTRGSNIRYDKVIWNKTATAGSIWNVNSNIDMNRDNFWFDMPSLRAIHTAFNAYFPEVAVDHHQWGTTRPYFGGYLNDNTQNGFVASTDANGNIMRNAEGRPYLLVSRDAAGNPIRRANQTMINLAPLDPRAASMGIGGGVNMYTAWGEIGLQYGDHLNNPRELQDYWTNVFQPTVTRRLIEERGVYSHHYIDGVIGTMDPDTYGPYYTGLLDENDQNIPDGTGIPSGGNEGAMFDPAHMFNALPLKPCLSFLVESRSSGALHYPKRVFAQYSSGEMIISHTANNATEIMNLVTNVRNKIAETGKVSTPNSSYAMDNVYNLMKMVQRTVTDEDWVTGDGRRVTLPTSFWRTGGAEPIVMRVRPTAYILENNKMNADVAKRLIFNGAKVEVLNAATAIQVEDFGVAEPMESKRFHDNTRRIVIAPSETVMNSNTVFMDPKFTPWSPPFWITEKYTPLEVKTITFPKGSFVIYMDQPTARSLVTCLEPDAERSYTRWSLARQMYADDPGPTCVPYRYMGTTRFDTTPLYMAWPQATGAGFMEVEPLSGTALESLAAEAPFAGKRIVVAETLHAYIDSTINMSFTMLSREELTRDMPNADFYFWNYKTEQYDLIPRNADKYKSVYVGEDYWGPFGEYGIQPIQFVATVGTDDGGNPIEPGPGSGGGGCDAGFGILALALIPFVLKRK